MSEFSTPPATDPTAEIAAAVAAAVAALVPLTSTVVSKATNFAVTSADNGKIFDCTAGLTCTIDDALPIGFSFYLSNASGAALIVETAGSEDVLNSAGAAAGAASALLVMTRWTKLTAMWMPDNCAPNWGET